MLQVGGASGGGGSGALEEHRRMRNYLLRVEREGVQRVKMFLVITAAYVIFWGPLFFVTLVHHPVIGNPLGYEVNNKEFSIHNICTRYVHFYQCQYPVLCNICTRQLL